MKLTPVAMNCSSLAPRSRSVSRARRSLRCQASNTVVRRSACVRPPGLSSGPEHDLGTNRAFGEQGLLRRTRRESESQGRHERVRQPTKKAGLSAPPWLGPAKDHGYILPDGAYALPCWAACRLSWFRRSTSASWAFALGELGMERRANRRRCLWCLAAICGCVIFIFMWPGVAGAACGVGFAGGAGLAGALVPGVVAVPGAVVCARAGAAPAMARPRTSAPSDVIISLAVIAVSFLMADWMGPQPLLQAGSRRPPVFISGRGNTSTSAVHELVAAGQRPLPLFTRGNAGPGAMRAAALQGRCRGPDAPGCGRDDRGSQAPFRIR